MNVLETINLTKTYGAGTARVEALKEINLTIKEGEFVAVVGPSGSGKSTMLHLLGGLDRPSSGKVIFEGRDLYDLSEKELSIFRRRKIGFIFQFYNLIPVLTAHENITLPILLDHREVDHNYINEIVKLLNITERLDHVPGELSGGEQQRVSIGRALAYKPSVIFANEPTGNLDRKNSKEVIDLLKFSARKYHQTLVIITHDLEIASQADRVIAIEDGMIVRDEAVEL